MTTSGKLLAAWGERLRANWPALLLPLVAVDTFGLFAGPLPGWLLTLAIITAFPAPKRGAKIAPFAFLVYGAYGLFLFHALSLWQSQPVVYGLLYSTARDNPTFVLFQAIAFLAAGTCLLAVTGAPGGGAVRKYFGIAEALTNAVRHSGADTVQIGIGYSDGMLRATIADGGRGGADPSAGTGLSGVERRLATFDGILAVTSPVGGPTIVAIELPCELSSTAPAARVGVS